MALRRQTLSPAERKARAKFMRGLEKSVRGPGPFRSSADRAGIRAEQYAMWLLGRDSPHSDSPGFTPPTRSGLRKGFGPLYAEFQGVSLPNWDWDPEACVVSAEYGLPEFCVLD